MKRIFFSMMVPILMIPVAGCSTRPAGHDPATQKVIEQRLATYSPLRRLTYRNACTDSGPLTVCVERISLSETASLVELRIRNRSETTYRSVNGNAPAIRLSTTSGSLLKGAVENLAHIPPFSEQYLYCKLAGPLSGRLKAVTLEDVCCRKIIDIELPPT